MLNETIQSQEPPRILIVDDTMANLELLSGVISERGYEPRPVLNGKMAILSAQTDPPDLILLDINMPGMDGFSVCEMLKADERTRDIPVIFITAFTETADKVHGFELGAVDYITKPFQIEEVRERVNTHLKIRALERQLRLYNENLEQQVAIRTRELARANEMLIKMGQLSTDFLSMISYELRTPVNGVVGIGEMLIDLCPETEETARYIELFRQSSERLVHLVQDAVWIAEIDNSPLKNAGPVEFTRLLAEIRAELDGVQLKLAPLPGLHEIMLQGDPVLLKQALTTLVQLALAFSRVRHSVLLDGAIEDGRLRLRVELDALRILPTAVTDFFKLESQVRAETTAETLGLAPVVAHKILSAFGGDLRLVKKEGNTGCLEALLTLEPLPAPRG